MKEERKRDSGRRREQEEEEKEERKRRGRGEEEQWERRSELTVQSTELLGSRGCSPDPDVVTVD